MVTTRKKPRISYIENIKSDSEDEGPVAGSSTAVAKSYVKISNASSTANESHASAAAGPSSAPAQDEMNDDDDLDAKDREFQPKGRNYQKRGAKKRARKSGSVGPKKPVFEYARILELPADILCNILSHLPLDNLYTLSISHRKFTSFLHSKASAGIWRDARKRLTVYAPKQFLNARDYLTMPPRDPLRHFDFVEMIPEAGTYEPSSQAEMEAAEKEDEKIALAVPAPPPGISEFSVARYLFCNICYSCGRDGRGTMTKVPELLAHFCKGCAAAHTASLKTALNDFEDALEPEQYAEIPLYNQFLLTLPAWKQTHSEANVDREKPLPPKDRRIYTLGLVERYEEFKAKRAAMTNEEFDAWFIKTVKEHTEARKQVGSLSEYLWLKQTFSRYDSRITAAIRTRNEKAIKTAIIDRLVGDNETLRLDAEKMMEPRLYRGHILPFLDSQHLEEEQWLTVKPVFEKHLAEYTAWVEANPLSRYPDTPLQAASIISSSIMYDSQLYPVSSTSRLELHSSLYLTLPHVKEILLNQPSDSTDQERRIWIRNRIQDNRQDIISDILTLQTKIKKDLARKVLLKDGKSVALVDDWDDAQLHEQLDRPEVYFRCTNCQPDTTYPFSDVVTHACASNDKGEKAFRNRYSGIPDSMCIPTEWQPDRIEVADGFKGVHDALQSIARTQHTGKFTGAAAARNPFKFPSSQTTVSTDHRWTFQCKLEACPMQSYMRLHNFIPHTAKHIREEKMTLKQLSDEYKPVVKVPEACNHHHHHHGLMHFDMDMDMYDSDDEPFYDEEW